MDAKKREETIQPQINADVRRYNGGEISEAYSSKSYLRRSAFICGCFSVLRVNSLPVAP
jgi:hypothetical protein